MQDTVQPLISFIIPVLNGERDIARCLSSIRNQKFHEGTYEVLIMDNGSSDRTHQIVRDLGFDFHIVPKVCVSALRNRGAALAQGEYLAFVDADIELTPFWLQGGIRGFRDRTIVATGSFPCLPKKATWVQQTWDLHRHRRRVETKPTPISWLGSANLIVQRNDFLAVGGFNEQLETTEDVDLCYRLAQRGTILYNPAMEAIHWGEDPDLRTFWRKEVWRGKGSLKGILSHGLCWDEIPSLGYPLYMMCCFLFFVLSMCVDLWCQQILFVPLSLVLLMLPAWLLACNAARVAKRPAVIPQLFLLYFIYGLARAFSVVKTWTTLLV